MSKGGGGGGGGGGGESGLETSGKLLWALSRTVPLEAIERAIEKTGKAEQRRRKLPSDLMVQLVVALGLISEAASRQVLAYLMPPGSVLPCKKAISKARYRVGPRPLIELLGQVAAASSASIAPRTAPWAFYKNLRLVSLDATTVDLPDTPQNEAVFGRPGSDPDKAQAAYPQARVVGWLETGARLIADLAVRPCKRHETAPGLALIRRNARPEQLILWDRGFAALHAQARAIVDRDAHFVGRIKKNAYLEAREVLPDGTYLSFVESPAMRGILSGKKNRKKKNAELAAQARRERVMVRIIEYKMGPKGETMRLATSLTDWREHGARDLAALYRERWEIETVFNEIKTHQRGRPSGQATLIRAQRPAGVVQEIYGLALAHRVVRSLMAAAAQQNQIDPDKLSFKNSLVIVRRHLPALSQAAPEDLPLF